MALLAPLLVVLLPAAAGGADPPQLIGTVGTGDAFVIALADAAGTKVTQLEPGSYTLLVRDNSAIHDFHLLGPGVDVATEVDATGDRTFTVSLAEGQYTYFCDPHIDIMRGSFTVGSPPPPPPPPPQTPGRKRLTAVVSGSTVSLSAKTVSAGAYRITVRDRSKTRNFHLVGPGVNRKTGVGFVGTAAWNVKLGRATYRFGSDPRLTKRLVVS